MNRKLAALMLIAAAAACGGSNDAFQRATPTYDAVAMDMTDSDAVTAEAPPPASTSQALTSATTDDPCHPHLFARTRMVVHATNGGLFRLLAPLRGVMDFPKHGDGTTRVWERVNNGIYWKYTMTKTGDHAFSAMLQTRKETDPDTALVTVYTAQVERNPAEHDGSGSATMDFTKLASVTGEPVGGTVSMSFTLSPAAKTIIYTLAGYHHGTDAPRDGKYVFHREPGKGGSLKFRENMPLACPGPGGSSTGTTPVSLVARWIDVTGGVHFRSDALAAGGQVAAGFKWEGVTCAEASKTVVEPGESYWMMKLEDGSNVTVSGSAHTNTTGASPCDAAFGAVPSVDSAANDYDFSKIDFTSDAVVPFP